MRYGTYKFNPLNLTSYRKNAVQDQVKVISGPVSSTYTTLVVSGAERRQLELSRKSGKYFASKHEVGLSISPVKEENICRAASARRVRSESEATHDTHVMFHHFASDFLHPAENDVFSGGIGCPVMIKALFCLGELKGRFTRLANLPSKS